MWIFEESRKAVAGSSRTTVTEWEMSLGDKWIRAGQQSRDFTAIGVEPRYQPSHFMHRLLRETGKRHLERNETTKKKHLKNKNKPPPFISLLVKKNTAQSLISLNGLQDSSGSRIICLESIPTPTRSRYKTLRFIKPRKQCVPAKGFLLTILLFQWYRLGKVRR